jgi:hypothetical protein
MFVTCFSLELRVTEVGATRLPRAMRPFAGVKIEVDSAVN